MLFFKLALHIPRSFSFLCITYSQGVGLLCFLVEARVHTVFSLVTWWTCVTLSFSLSLSLSLSPLARCFHFHACIDSWNTASVYFLKHQPMFTKIYFKRWCERFKMPNVYGPNALSLQWDFFLFFVYFSPWLVSLRVAN